MTMRMDTEVDTVRDITDEEVFLRPVMPMTKRPYLRCTNCGYLRYYTFWYKTGGYCDRKVDFCPGCGFPIAGTLLSEEELDEQL